MLKECSDCKGTKDSAEFYVQRGYLSGKCRTCYCRAVRENRAAKREQYSAYEAKRFQDPARKAATIQYQRTRRQRHPDRDRARRLVGRALRAGRLERLPCEKCGSVKSQAHHEDYSRPLDVRWLCFPCHRAEHGQTVVSERYNTGGIA